MNDENRQSIKQTNKPKEYDYTGWEIEIALSSVQHLYLAVW